MALNKEDLQAIASLLQPLQNQITSLRDDVESIKATIAVKDDIKNMATKDDIRDMVTKDDIRNTVTKDDLQNMATKDDIKDMATKADLEKMATKSDLENMATKADIKDMATKADLENMATKDDIKDMATKADLENLATKDDLIASENLILEELSRTHNIMIQRTEKLEKDFREMRQDMAVMKSNNDQMSLLLDKVDGLGRRVAVLESRSA